MDAITRSERGTGGGGLGGGGWRGLSLVRSYKKNLRRGKNTEVVRIGGRDTNCHLACVVGRLKISLIPCPPFPLWICQWRDFWFPHPVLLRRRRMTVVTLTPVLGHCR